MAGLTWPDVQLLLSITTNQMLVAQEDRRPGVLSFSINVRGEHHFVRVETVSPHSIHGFQTNLTGSYFMLHPGC